MRAVNVEALPGTFGLVTTCNLVVLSRADSWITNPAFDLAERSLGDRLIRWLCTAIV